MNIFDSQSSLKIILVRAGSTELDDQGRISGALDMPLSEAGEKEARKTAHELRDYKFEAIYSAQCRAAQQTAQRLAEESGVRVRVEEGMTNLDHGLWHGKCLKELKKNQPKLYRQWNENPDSICPPGGETVEAVRGRIMASLKKMRRKWRTGTIAIVAPHPIYNIIRSVVESSEVRDLFMDKSKSNRWESLDVVAVA